jgi:DNA-binding CsgD family transcriptional regulator
MKRNQDIRNLIRDSKICNWQVAEALKISDNTFYMLLRKKLTDSDRQRILSAIETVKEQQQQAYEQTETV